MGSSERRHSWRFGSPGARTWHHWFLLGIFLFTLMLLPLPQAMHSGSLKYFISKISGHDLLKWLHTFKSFHSRSEHHQPWKTQMSPPALTVLGGVEESHRPHVLLRVTSGVGWPLPKPAWGQPHGCIANGSLSQRLRGQGKRARVWVAHLSHSCLRAEDRINSEWLLLYQQYKLC